MFLLPIDATVLDQHDAGVAVPWLVQPLRLVEHSGELLQRRLLPRDAVCIVRLLLKHRPGDVPRQVLLELILAYAQGSLPERVRHLLQPGKVQQGCVVQLLPAQLANQLPPKRADLPGLYLLLLFCSGMHGLFAFFGRPMRVLSSDATVPYNLPAAQLPGMDGPLLLLQQRPSVGLQPVFQVYHQLRVLPCHRQVPQSDAAHRSDLLQPPGCLQRVGQRHIALH